MAKPEVLYELSHEADRDLEDIFDYTEREFGFDQAIDYLSGFESLFAKLVNNPELGKEREEIREGLRSLLKEKHVVFYRRLGNQIRIVRILHGSRDLRTFLT
ncbi:MAG: type II toxin-antitoxin system RelE/ParE family toxin [Nitrospirota bacterium]|nr:type II toxin-antitoxin system RelE/ParE family toxin [Nitrospirota bacterium]